MQSFKYQKIELSNEKRMHEIYALRYQVYVNECGFLKAEDYPEGIETDIYDAQSAHFAAINEDDDVVGTLRLILPGAVPLPIQNHCVDVLIDKNPRELLPQVHFAEISRLIISKQLRRRRHDGQYYEPETMDRVVEDPTGNTFIRRSKPMAFGLYRQMYLESKRCGVTHWYTIMEKSLWLLLRIHGFTFECIGDEVDVYGPVNPYIGKVTNIEKDIKKKFPEFYDYLFADKEAENKVS
jgi:N-acyl amino acid synthase of PEP-CTERM/exosortase system